MSTDMAVDHVNGNGTEESTEPMDTAAVEVTRSEHFQTLLDAGLPQKVAEKLDEVYIAGTVCCDPPSPREVLSPDSSWHRHIFNHSGLTHAFLVVISSSLLVVVMLFLSLYTPAAVNYFNTCWFRKNPF